MTMPETPQVPTVPAQSPPAPAAEVESPSPEAPAPASFKAGQLVVHSSPDLYGEGDGVALLRYGVVVEVVPDSTDADGAEVRGGPKVAWLSREVSGPFPADHLQAV